jgi:hypothetical protein
LIPRPIVIVVVLGLLLYLGADVIGQFIPGSTHEASPVIDGAILGVLGSVLAASRGPQPTPPPEQPPDDPPPPTEPAGRHRGGD